MFQIQTSLIATLNTENLDCFLSFVKINLDVNKWIYSELLKTTNEAQKYISNFRFDEAARVIYQFVCEVSDLKDPFNILPDL